MKISKLRRERGLVMQQVLSFAAFGTLAILALAGVLVVGMKATAPDRNKHQAFTTSTNAAVEAAQVSADDPAAATSLGSVSNVGASVNNTDPRGNVLNGALQASAANGVLLVTSTVNGQPITVHVPVQPRAAAAGTSTSAR